MYGWCEKCNTVALEGLCSKHGKTKPISTINSIDMHPLPEFEKQIINKYLGRKGLKLGWGVFLVYMDRMYRRRIVTLDKPLIEIKLLKDGLHINPLVKNKKEINGMGIKSLCISNKSRIDRLTKIAKTFVQWELDSNENAIISFSGGKDSTVLTHLLDEFKLKKVFIDTGIEFSETYRFVTQLQKKGWDIDIARAETDFFKLCQFKNYPEYKNRWCCKTQKFVPFAAYLNKNFKKKKVLVFSAIRRWESLSRLDQPLKKQHKYITNQNTMQPILDWLSMDAWIYTWINKLPVNRLYHYFDRGGCWTCPFGLKYRFYLLRYSHPKLYKNLQRIQNR